MPTLLEHPALLTRTSGLFQRRVVAPILDLLRIGATPERLAWSLAVGLAIGINPLLGSTTLLCLAVAYLFRLNVIASQITNHLVYPLEILLFFVFIRAGNLVFHTGSLPLDRDSLLAAVRHHPWQTTVLLWRWEWHALVVWAVSAAAVTPLLALALRLPLRRLLVSLQDQPIVEK